MSGATFWFRTAGFTVWALIVLAALRSEPLWQLGVGDQYSITGQWCGPWGCTASLPKLLAWQIPVSLVTVPAAWILVHSVPPVRRRAGVLALALVVGTLCWLAASIGHRLSLGQIYSVTHVGRYAVFACMAGTSVAIPVLLAGITCLVARRRLRKADTENRIATADDVGSAIITQEDNVTQTDANAGLISRG